MATKKLKINREYVQNYIQETGFPEVGTYDDPAMLKKFYKHCDAEQLAEWLALEGLSENVKPTDSEQIYRMRQCMEILYLHFPKTPAKKKKQSPYAVYTLDNLLELCLEADVELEMCDDERILRMRAIMALKPTGVFDTAE